MDNFFNLPEMTMENGLNETIKLVVQSQPRLLNRVINKNPPAVSWWIFVYSVIILTCNVHGSFFPDNGNFYLAGKSHLSLNFLSYFKT